MVKNRTGFIAWRVIFDTQTGLLRKCGCWVGIQSGSLEGHVGGQQMTVQGLEQPVYAMKIINLG